MNNDLKSNSVATLVDASASLAAAASRNATSVDLSNFGGAVFLVYVTNVNTGGTLTAKIQYSADDSTFTDEPDTVAGNSTVTATISAVGLTRLHVPSPRARYIRVRSTAATDAVVFSVISVAGPKLFA